LDKEIMGVLVLTLLQVILEEAAVALVVLEEMPLTVVTAVLVELEQQFVMCGIQ
jgi:hypothetical protein